MPEKPWTELTGNDLLSRAFRTASMVKAGDSSSVSLEAIMNPLPGAENDSMEAYMDKISQYVTSVSVQDTDHFPASEDELEALAMIEKLAGEGVAYCDAFALGAELAARNGAADKAIQLAKKWAIDCHENHLSVLFPLLACGRHIASLLLQKIIAAELNLSDSVVNDFLVQAIETLNKRFQNGRSPVYGDLSWKDLLIRLSQTSITFEEQAYDEAVRQSGWIGFEGQPRKVSLPGRRGFLHIGSQESIDTPALGFIWKTKYKW